MHYKLTRDYPQYPIGTLYEKTGEETFLSRKTHSLKCLSDGNYTIKVTDKELNEEFEETSK